jgi:hypothetical protein
MMEHAGDSRILAVVKLEGDEDVLRVVLLLRMLKKSRNQTLTWVMETISRVPPT